MSDNFRQQINNIFPSDHLQINSSSSYTISSNDYVSKNYNAPVIGTFDGNPQIANLNDIDNNPLKFCLTHPQLLQSQPLSGQPLLFGPQQSLFPQQPRPFFPPNSQYTISNPQVSHHD